MYEKYIYLYMVGMYSVFVDRKIWKQVKHITLNLYELAFTLFLLL